MNRDILISICILTYNHEDYIEECLESIFNQNKKYEIEVLISDDSSTDSTVEVIEKYILKNNFSLKLNVNSVNKGVIGNLIELLKMSKGKYIAFCEGDDYWVDDMKISKQVSFLESNNAYSMVFTNRYIQSIDGEIKFDNFYKKSIYNIKDVVEGFIPGTQTMMIRNYHSIVEYFNNYNAIYSGDRFIAYFCSLFGNLYKLDDVTATYRQTNTGVWSKFTPLEKLEKHNELLLQFHDCLGIPTNNEILAKNYFNNSFLLFLYCLKRPLLFFDKNKMSFIFRPFIMFKKMIKWKFVFFVIKNRLSNNE